MNLSALPRSLALLEAIIADGGRSSVAALARSVGMPAATAHRHVSTLVEQSYLAPAGYGRHIAGSRLRALAIALDQKQIIASTAGPILDGLAVRTRAIVQLGTFENDMVTYRIKTGRGAARLFTRTGMQLEAYCSGIGKVLLAYLPAAEREAYLDTGPFPPLTAHTITEPAQLRVELANVRKTGFAIDDEEASEGLRCMAMPIFAADERVIAAISVSQDLRSRHLIDDDALKPLLAQAADEISRLASAG